MTAIDLTSYAPEATAGRMWMVICILTYRAEIQSFSLYAGFHS